MYISSATEPVNHLDALPLLLDHILGGGDVILTDEGVKGPVLLDWAAACLGGLRSRILRAPEVLPGTLGVPIPGLLLAEPTKASVPDDELLTQGFRALTVRDQTCDRIVLLVNDAHALQQSALRYIQFASQSTVHLQLVLCGTRKLFDLLDADELAWLRTRLKAALVVTLAAPVAKAPRRPPSLPFIPVDLPARVGDTAARSTATRRRAVLAGLPTHIVWLGALALLGLGGAAWLAFGPQDGGATSKQAAVVIQPPATPQPPAVSAPRVQAQGGVAAHADIAPIPAPPDALVPHSPVVASDVQGAGHGSPASTSLPAAGSVVPAQVWPQTKADAAVPEANKPRLPEPLPGPAPSLARQDAPAAPSPPEPAAVLLPSAVPEPPATLAPETQTVEGAASHADAKAAPAAPDAPVPHLPAMTSDVQSAGSVSPSSMPPLTPTPTVAPGALVATLPHTKAGVPESGPTELRRPEPQPGSTQDIARPAVSTAPPRTAAAAPSIRARRLKAPKEQLARLPVDNHGSPSQATPGSAEPSDGGSPRYVGSYSTDANGVRMFHLGP